MHPQHRTIARGCPCVAVDASYRLGVAACYGAAMLTDRAGLPADELAQLTTRIAEHRILEHVVRDWGRGQPPRPIVGVITQDEYTHDVIIAYRDDIHLVYDTT